ncbi:MAG: ATP-dependent Clp protease proteolytic subunit [Alphaproteobacteria bacterium]|nr:MAG: ATP-dependent Clp protease proteolytic subunit [Alphaproteobacteria bacterium]
MIQSLDLAHPGLVRLDDEDAPDETPTTPPTPDAPQPGPETQALFKGRFVMIFGPINMKLAREVTARLLALSTESNEPIKVIINSPGGHVESGDTIHDMIRFVGAPVKVIGTGWVASAGAHIFLGAAKENRLCLPNTRFLLHQPSGGVRGPAIDIGIEAREIIKMRERLNRTIADATGQSLERVTNDTDRNYWMSAEEALEYGVVGRIIQSIGDV